MILSMDERTASMGDWVYRRLVDKTVEGFVHRAIPDAEPGWEDLPWRIEEMGRTDDDGMWWTVVVDIPTSVKCMDCWLTFHIVEPGDATGEPYAEKVSAVRSGRGEHEFDVYVWDDAENEWTLASAEDEHVPSADELNRHLDYRWRVLR